MSTGRITSKQFREMGVLGQDGTWIAFEEHLRRCFDGVFEKHAAEFEKIYRADEKDKK